MTVYGKYLREQRVAAGLSLRAVADELGVTHVYLGEVERGQRGPLPEKHWDTLCITIPSITKSALRRAAEASKPIQIDIAAAPPRYRNLALVLHRRIKDHSLKDEDFNRLEEILGADEDE